MFFLAKISMKVVFDMLFLIFINVNILYNEKKPSKKIYITKKRLSMLCNIKLVDKNMFAEAALVENIKVFVTHIHSLVARLTIYLFRKV